MLGCFALLAVLAPGAPLAHAQNQIIGNPDYAAYQDPTMRFASYGIPITPLRRGLKELKVVPAYLSGEAHLTRTPATFNASGAGPTTMSIEDNSASGFGVVVSWVHGLSDHWGYSVTGAFARMSGESVAWAEYNAANALVKEHKADESGHAMILSAMLILDPFSDPEGFRLPLFLGFQVMKQVQEADLEAAAATLGASTRYRNELDATFGGPFVGASAQFNTGPVRWAPFAAIQIKGNNPTSHSTLTNAASGAVLKTGTFTNGDDFLPYMGVGVLYRPWNLGMTWVPNAAKLFGEEEDVSSNLLTVSKTFSF